MESADYTPPVRRSMSDDELARLVNQPFGDEATMLAAMELLETQTALRAEDERAAAMWQVEMQVIGTAESLAALDAFRKGEVFDIEVFRQELATQATAQIDNAPEPQLNQLEQSAQPSLFEQIAQAKVESTPTVKEVAPDAHETQNHEATATLMHDFGFQEREIETADAELDSSDAELDTTDAELEAAVAEKVAGEGQFPLIPIGPAPDISVAGVAPAQQVASLDFAVDGPVSASEQSTLVAPEANLLDDFDEIFQIPPQASSEYLDAAKNSISTAHDPAEKQGAAALFLNWLPIGGSVIPVVLAVYLHSLGLPLTDAVTAMSLAIFAAFVTTTFGAIAGKRSGLGSFIVSRATFGVLGARIPALFFAIVKIVSALVLLLFLASAFNSVVLGWQFDGPNSKQWQLSGLTIQWWQVVVAIAGITVCCAAFLRLKVAKLINFAVGAFASLVACAFLAMQFFNNNYNTVPSFYYLASWPETLGAATLVFAAIGTVWSSSGADFARDIRKDAKGASVFAWSALALLLLPALLATATLILLDGSTANASLLGFASIVPSDFGGLGLAAFLGVVLLLSAIEFRSAILALGSIAEWLKSKFAILLVASAFVLVALFGWQLYGLAGIFFNLRDYAVVISVPVAAWLGIFTADTALRRIAYHEISLTRTYGFYGNYNVLNLVGLGIATSVGLGMISSDLPEFQWLGYLSKFADDQTFWATSNLGVGASFAIGALVPICFGVRRIRLQEAEVLSIESRRYELRDVLVAPSTAADNDIATPMVPQSEVVDNEDLIQ